MFHRASIPTKPAVSHSLPTAQAILADLALLATLEPTAYGTNAEAKNFNAAPLMTREALEQDPEAVAESIVAHQNSVKNIQQTIRTTRDVVEESSEKVAALIRKSTLAVI
ncbi:hypothetical protein SpCBS45565_g02487 [Spizellomyces sp. 'palustris']|nr:hypothetical protein SpCBS45565_g02487 [Spizellomyces sp. 'palustris']